jgi:hypothetical protein
MDFHEQEPAQSLLNRDPLTFQIINVWDYLFVWFLRKPLQNLALDGGQGSSGFLKILGGWPDQQYVIGSV